MCAKNMDPKGTSKVFDERAGMHEATNKKGANEAEEIVSIIGRFLVLVVASLQLSFAPRSASPSAKPRHPQHS